MQPTNAEQLQNQAYAQMGQGDYAGAQAMLEQYGGQFPEMAASWDYLRSCCAARQGNLDEAESILEERIGSDFWYGARIFRESPSYAALQGRERFERLVTLCAEREQSDGAAGSLVVLQSEGGAAGAPCIIALHGNGQSGADAVREWGSATSLGWAVAVPSSNLRMWRHLHMWNSPDETLPHVQGALAALREAGANTERLVLGGFSMGGAMSLWLGLSGIVQAQTIIAVGAGGGETGNLDAWRELIPGAAERGVRVALLIGEADETIPQEVLHQLGALLNEGGVPCTVHTFPGVAHAFPAEFPQLLAELLG